MAAFPTDLNEIDFTESGSDPIVLFVPGSYSTPGSLAADTEGFAEALALCRHEPMRLWPDAGDSRND